MKGWLPTATLALALLTVVAAGWVLVGPGSQLALLLGCIALVLLLELPAVWWRLRGGSLGTTLVVAILGPLVPLEILLAISAWEQRGLGGDLQGIEQVLMTFVVPPFVVVAGSIFTVLVCLVVRPTDEEE